MGLLCQFKAKKDYATPAIEKIIMNTIKSSEENQPIAIPVDICKNKLEVLPGLWEMGGYNVNKDTAMCMIIGDENGKKISNPFRFANRSTKPNGKHALVKVDKDYIVSVGLIKKGMTRVFLYKIEEFVAGEDYGYSEKQCSLNGIAHMRHIGSYTSSWNMKQGMFMCDEKYKEIVDVTLEKLHTKECHEAIYVNRWFNYRKQSNINRLEKLKEELDDTTTMTTRVLMEIVDPKETMDAIYKNLVGDNLPFTAIRIKVEDIDEEEDVVIEYTFFPDNTKNSAQIKEFVIPWKAGKDDEAYSNVLDILKIHKDITSHSVGQSKWVIFRGCKV